MDFVPIYSGYACMRRYIDMQNTIAVRLGEKHPHLPLYSAKRERTFEVGRFYTVSVPSNLQLFFENDFLQIAVLKSDAKLQIISEICKKNLRFRTKKSLFMPIHSEM